MFHTRVSSLWKTVLTSSNTFTIFSGSEVSRFHGGPFVITVFYHLYGDAGRRRRRRIMEIG